MHLFRRYRAFFLILTILTIQISALIDVNCTALGIFDTHCEYSVINAINKYINQDLNYSKKVPPRINKNELPILVNATMGLNHIPDVSMLEGTLTITSLLQLTWTDDFLAWDPQWTPGAYAINIDSSWPWTPDFVLYNSVGLFENQISKADVILSYDGSISWSRTLEFTYLCSFGLKNFPFDSQSCNAKFGSFRDSGFITDFQFGDETYLFNLNEFKSPSWQIDGISEYRTVEYNSYGSTTFLNWTVKLTRYSGFYVTTIIIPVAMITVLSITTLWINDLSARLTISTLTVLIIVSVLWSLSITLPITSDLTWIQKYTSGSCIVVIFVCFESSLSAYMTMKKGRPAFWVKYLIVISTPRKFWFFIFGNKDENQKKKNNKPSSDIELNDMDVSTSTNALHADTVIDNKSSINEDEDQDNPQWHYDTSAITRLVNENHVHKHSTSTPGRKLSIVEVENYNATWIRGSRALDRLSRTVFSIGYLIYFIAILSSIPSTTTTTTTTSS